MTRNEATHSATTTADHTSQFPVITTRDVLQYTDVKPIQARPPRLQSQTYIITLQHNAVDYTVSGRRPPQPSYHGIFLHDAGGSTKMLGEAGGGWTLVSGTHAPSTQNTPLPPSPDTLLTPLLARAAAIKRASLLGENANTRQKADKTFIPYHALVSKTFIKSVYYSFFFFT
ncbi:hypothetical protein E2C01_065753 [Portunus trituberculatus]|uniref:Uncharacterized protein n=1 Tax=Portunus trituberculatus TaxID=210409 RepID=A0A5B7HP99_PORTR|nr:hypothetical protein [Portunus trituberculatus]